MGFFRALFNNEEAVKYFAQGILQNLLKIHNSISLCGGHVDARNREFVFNAIKSIKSDLKSLGSSFRAMDNYKQLFIDLVWLDGSTHNVDSWCMLVIAEIYDIESII